MSSPFKPISSPSGSLKSPLNNMQMPQQPQPQMYLNANENNVPLNLPAQKSRENAETERGANPTQNRGAQPEPPFKKNSRRKSSLTQKMAKNLDSILEDSEHDSSTCLEQKSSSEGSCSSSVSSFNEAPEDFNEDQEDFNENQEDFDEDQEDFKEDSEDFNSDEEDFDSDCSVASDELEQELLGINNYQADLIQFQKTTDKLVEKQQSEMIERIMKSEPNSPLFPAEPYLDQNKMNREQLPGIVHQPRIVSWEAFNNSKSEGVNQIVTKSIELPKVNNFEETRLLQAAAQEISSNKTRKYPNQVDLVAQQLSNLELETSPDKSELVPDIEYYRDRVSQMLQFKDALLGEKQSMEDDHDKRFRHTARPDKNFGGPEPKTQRDSDIEKRKVEIEVFFEAIDTLIDLKNATITNLQYEKPSVDDPSEQDFLMKQLDALSSDEAKHLSHSFMHKIIDHRIEGRAKDRQLRSLDEKERNLNKEIKDLRKYSAHRDVKYQDLKKDLRKSDRSNRDKDNQIEVLTEKLEKYKAYWKMNQKGSGERYVSSGSGTKPSEMITQEGIEIIEQAKPTVVRREKNRLTIGTTDSFDKAKY